jgi:hypothetical protein
MARTTLGEHERILAAIVARDEASARSAMQDHLAGAAYRVGLPVIDSDAPKAARAAPGRKVPANKKLAASGNVVK